jgi:hypothetical protein
VIDDRRLAYLDYGGSGNETARHAEAEGPVTVMVMSTDSRDAAIIRLYGHASVTPLDESPLADHVLADEQPVESIGLVHRQVVEIEVESTATSCGYGVPVLEFHAQRTKAEHGRRYKA